MSSTADELLVRLAELGATVRPAGDHLFLRAGAMPIPGDLVKRLREAKPDLVRALSSPRQTVGANDDPAWWRRQYIVRTINWGLSSNRREGGARRLAWGELQNGWYNRHGRRWPAWQCAGCGAPIGGLVSLTLGDENRVHLDRLGCLIAFGERWRSEATAGLQALGLNPPEGLDLP